MNVCIEDIIDKKYEALESKPSPKNINEIYSFFEKKYNKFYQDQSLFNQIGILWLSSTDDMTLLVLDQLFYSLGINKEQMKLMLDHCTPWGEWIVDFNNQSEIREILLHTSINLAEPNEPIE
ncbi:hypothetical protein BKG96_10430 [Rodentibacter caecimuris]|uniref:Uncharacterized protein n=1 Tax=Rodentibacter caecimuris TaxID=1796644 RepID=A0A1V3KF79_9PAST|nr:hypothetical protein [Rodentibacter heylii]OOF75844.1 hypothetical protein BKG96_10430 [Rodentibacter heylii]